MGGGGPKAGTDRVPAGIGPLLVVLLALLVSAAPAKAQTEGTKPDCSGSLQAEVDAAAPGTTVELARGCVYREMVTVGKPLTLSGGGEGGIRGSDVWKDWKEQGGRWTSAKPVPRFAAPERSVCEEGTRRCLQHEQVFADGEPLAQVDSDPEPGQFALDAGRRVVLAESPAGHRIEVTTRPSWIVGAADDVTVRGIAMKHAAETGVWNGGYSRWVVEGNDLSHAHEKNLALTLGRDLAARGNELHDAGQLGMSSNEADVEIVGNRVYGNNTEGFSAVWEAGGMKVSQARTATISGNEVYRNGEIGIWTDVVNGAQTSVRITDNRVHHNPRQGIRVEITKNFVVRDNVLWENGWGQGDSYNGSGISVNGSRDGLVAGNVLAWNASGIGVVQQDRDGAHEQDYDTTANIRLEGNEVIQDEVPGASDHAAVFWNGDVGAVAGGAPSVTAPESNNAGTNNAYWFDEPEGTTPRFKWDRQLETLAEYEDTPAEKGGRYLSAGEKNALLQEHALPASPPPRPASPDGPGGFVAGVLVWVRSLLS